MRTLLARWLGLSLGLTVVFLVTDSIGGLEVRPLYLFVLGLFASGLWLGAAPLVWRCAERLPVHGVGAAGRVAVHALIAVVFAFTLAGLFALFIFFLHRTPFGEDLTLWRSFQSAVYYFFLADVLFYTLVVVARRAHDLATRLRDEEVRLEKVEAELVRARLDALSRQLNPHFLFNTLNTVAGLMRSGEDQTALRVISRLGDVLRQALEDADTAEVALEDELASLEKLLDIERCRFGDRLIVNLDVEPDLLDQPVPRWLFQPLVENAIEHGVEADPDAGIIDVRARREGNELVLEVHDDGPGPTAAPAEGIGLGNTRSRLRSLHGEHASLTIERKGAGGTLVRVRLPLAKGDSRRSELTARVERG